MKKAILILGLILIGLFLFGCTEAFQEGFNQGLLNNNPQFTDCGIINSDVNENSPEYSCFEKLITTCSPGKAVLDFQTYSLTYSVGGISETCDFNMEMKIGTEQISNTICKVPPLKMIGGTPEEIESYCTIIKNEENIEKYTGKTEGFSGFRVDYFTITGYKNDPDFAQFSTSIINEGTDFVGVDYRKIFFEKNGKSCKGRIYRTLGAVQSDGNLVKMTPSHAATFSGVIFGEECGLEEPNFEYKVFFDINYIQNGNPAGKVEGTVSGTYLQPTDLYNYYSDKCWIQRINDDYYYALENCTKAFDMGPRNYNVIDDLFILYQDELKDYYGCIEYGDKAIEAFPNRPDNYYIVGTCYQYLEDYNGARPYYQKALELSPIHEQARRGLIATYKFIEEDYQKMHDLVDEGLELNPYSIDMMHLKGVVYYYENDWENCKEWLYKVRDIDPDWGQNNKFINYCENPSSKDKLMSESTTFGYIKISFNNTQTKKIGDRDYFYTKITFENIDTKTHSIPTLDKIALVNETYLAMPPTPTVGDSLIYDDKYTGILGPGETLSGNLYWDITVWPGVNEPFEEKWISVYPWDPPSNYAVYWILDD